MTELMLFEYRTKTPQFLFPSLNGTTIPLSSGAKYIGDEIDTKLNSKMDVEKRIKKAYVPYYNCNWIISGNWWIKQVQLCECIRT